MKIGTLELALLCATSLTLLIGILRTVELAVTHGAVDDTLNQVFTSCATVTAGLLGAVLVAKGGTHR